MSRNQREGWYYGHYSTLMRLPGGGWAYRALDVGAPPDKRKHHRTHQRQVALADKRWPRGVK